MRTNPNDPINKIGGEGAIAIGLTKREYFAAMAMQGLVSNPIWQNVLTQKQLNEEDLFATSAVQYADALIEALNAEADHAE